MSSLNNGYKEIRDITVFAANGETLHQSRSTEPSSRDPMVESSSSEDSTTKEPVCTQLLTQLNTAYQHLAPDAQAIFYNQDNGGKLDNGIQLVVPKPPKDYKFSKWNWPKIRQSCFILTVSFFIAITLTAIRGILTLPTRCEAQTEWWQGKIFYEIFPASFQDSLKGSDGIGDIRGITMRIDYLKNMGVKAIRLNSIFSSTHYPEQYENINSLTRISDNLGTIEDFDNLVDSLHKNNMTLIIDIPSYPFIESFKIGIDMKRKKNFLLNNIIDDDDENYINKRIKRQNINDKMNKLLSSLFDINEPMTDKLISSNYVDSDSHDNELTSALNYWVKKNVDGFYLKGLEEYVEDSEFVNYLNEWRHTVKRPKILMCHWKTYQMANDLVKSSIVKTMDLLDATIVVSNGTRDIKRQIDQVIKSSLFSIDTIRPWIHWSVGGIDMSRMTSTLQVKNATSAAMIMEMMLPGTSNIFYGDEIGMVDCECEDHRDLLHVHNLPPMSWDLINNSGEKFSSHGVMPWLPNTGQPVLTNIKDAVKKMAHLRQTISTIVVDSAFKHGHSVANCDVRFADDELIVIERSYPRLNTYVMVANFSNRTIAKDFSSLYYEGHIVVGPEIKINQSVYFKELAILPGEAFVIKLKK
ncbi:neutral and basic amino acid transport protein rBAT-like isoform X2 [Aphidius gifuensis]|uniref:neutral and basic amino acid transport protein rBAT-like isoform X2 n=1 Tax=Aphidius gifuensis TaxID=684658 RepID=UPI001CDCE3DC|nr:neutral and basic amino acid transport protein rBAT-like isoform X2 [Aphidius gifuensis]